MKNISLIQMKKNQRGQIAAISAGHNLENRLMSMGIYKGKEITKLSHFALKGPVAVKVGRSVLALGHGIAGRVMVGVE
jgi:Fe2+ transport system protein FeoA